MSSRTTSQLQADVDQHVHLVDAPWRAPLIFEVASTSSRDPDRATIESSLLMQDITSCLGGQKPGILRLYFDPRKYKTDFTTTATSNQETESFLLVPAQQQEQPELHDESANKTKKKSPVPPVPPDFHILKKDLENAALQGNNKENGGIQFPLFSNGSSGGCRYTRRFHCAGCINRVNTKRHQALTKKREELKHTYRCSDIINDRRNSRGPGGKTRIRRTTSVASNRSCTFGFTVRWDRIGFYVSLEKNSGCPLHRYHAPSDNRLSVRTRLLPDDERDTLDHLAASCCTTGVGGSFIMSKLGRYMSKGKVAYVYSQARANDKPTTANNNNDDNNAMSEYDHLTRYFESTNEIAYTVLWDVVPTLPGHNDQSEEEQLNQNSTPFNSAGGCDQRKEHSSLLLSHTKLSNCHSCQKDHTNDESMSGLRMEGRLCRVVSGLPTGIGLHQDLPGYCLGVQAIVPPHKDSSV